MMRPWRCCFYVQDYCVYLSVCGSRQHIPMVMIFGEPPVYIYPGLVGGGREVDVPWAYSQKWKQPMYKSLNTHHTLG